ncbi:MAG TPA: hypothetical protein VJP76_06535, partial [Candidatus Tumulicola sp.]|nr:hypothetical protein [Candidatus Tumulicola sp.]
TTLARAHGGDFSTQSNFLASLEQDPILSRVKLIAEPWDVGPGGYRAGDFPAGWSEWNDRFRDSVRRFWRGDGSMPELATRLTGSSDIFDRRGRRPRASVNFVTAHDGFTLNDLVSYDRKHNDANLEDGRDGTDENYSWNCGAEGPTENSDIVALRERQKRNLMATLLLSQGVPMLLAGDELGHTQRGNNNAYCQDNEISWLERGNLLAADAKLFEFVRYLIEIRREHPVFRRPRFFRGVATDDATLKDITWYAPDARELTSDDWNDPGRRCFGALLGGDVGDRFVSLQGYREVDDSFLIAINGYDAATGFTLPPAEAPLRWLELFDTAAWDGSPRNVILDPGTQIEMAARSFALFVAR